jgi:hypothetical protein
MKLSGKVSAGTVSLSVDGLSVPFTPGGNWEKEILNLGAQPREIRIEAKDAQGQTSSKMVVVRP